MKIFKDSSLKSWWWTKNSYLSDPSGLPVIIYIAQSAVIAYWLKVLTSYTVIFHKISWSLATLTMDSQELMVLPHLESLKIIINGNNTPIDNDSYFVAKVIC